MGYVVTLQAAWAVFQGLASKSIKVYQYSYILSTFQDGSTFDSNVKYLHRFVHNIERHQFWDGQIMNNIILLDNV